MNFEEWWATQNQTIGRTAAAAAWNYLMDRIRLADRLRNANLPGFIPDALRGNEVLSLPLFEHTTIGEFLDAVEREDQENNDGR